MTNARESAARLTTAAEDAPSDQGFDRWVLVCAWVGAILVMFGVGIGLL